MGTQYVTPDLRRWIAEQLKAGVSAPDLVQSMTGAGWQQKIALQAVAQAKLDGWFGKGKEKAADKPPRLPEPKIADGHTWLQAHDRKISVVMAMEHPRVVVFGNVLVRTNVMALNNKLNFAFFNIFIILLVNVLIKHIF